MSIDYIKRQASVIVEMVSDMDRARAKDALSYACVEDFVLREGREYQHAPLPADIKAGEEQQCYANAYYVAKAKPEKYAYVEGLAWIGILICQHAWLTDKEGKLAYDPTWVYDWTWAKPREYLGIPFDMRYAEGGLRRVGAVINDYNRRAKNRFPILSGDVRRGRYLHRWFR